MDYGTDPLVSTLYAREHQYAKEALQPTKMGALQALRQRHKWKNTSLAELRDQAVTPAMLIAAGATWPALQAKHGAEALINFGFDWDDMRASGFTAKHLSTLTFDQISRLGLTAPRMLECRPSASDLSAMTLHVEQMKDLGWNDELLRAVGINVRSMVKFGYPLAAWHDVLGVSDFSSLGFDNYAECARMGWKASDIALAMPSEQPQQQQQHQPTTNRRTDGRIQFI